MSAERDRGSSPLLPAGHIRPAMEAMCSLLRAGRAPSELMARYAAADSRRGRNDPLPLRVRPQMETLPPAGPGHLRDRQ